MCAIITLNKSVLLLVALLVAGIQAQQYHCSNNGSEKVVTCYDHEVTDGKPPADYCYHSSIYILKLDGTSIKTLSQSALSFVSNCHFDVFVLKDSQVEKIEPAAFGNLPRMRAIILSGNKIKTLTKDAFKRHDGGNKKLLTVYLDNNEVESIEEGAFADLTALDTLDLSYNKFTEIDLTKLPKNIKMLNIEHNNLQKLTGGAGEYSISILDATHTNMKPAQLSFLKADALETLFIAENNLNAADLAPLTIYKNLQTLNISGNHLSELQPTFFDNFPHIKYIDVSNTGLKGTSLAAIMANKPNLAGFYFNNNEINKFDFTAVPSNVQISFHGNKLQFKCNELETLINDLEARNVTVKMGSDTGDNVDGIACQK